MRTIGLLAFAAALVGCTRPPPAEASASEGVDAGARTSSVVATAELFPAVRCGECHGTFENEWRESTHARASASAAFVAMRAHSKGSHCERCHAPFQGISGVPEVVREETVTCQACHAIEQVAESDGGVGFQATRRLSDVVMFGPLCDAKDHHFHKMGCSPLHAQSEVCASCHELQVHRDDGTLLPIYTEYSDWKRGPSAEEGTPCQGCHMPTRTDEVAVGAGRRELVPQHRFLPAELRSTALGLTLTAQGGCGELKVTAELVNRGGGHPLPAGNPGRELVLRVHLEDPKGARLGMQERAWARRLGDVAGNEVPWTDAVRVLADERIKPDERRAVSVRFDGAPCRGRVVAELGERSVSPAVAQRLEIPVPEVAMLVSRTASFSARARGATR